MFFRPSPIDKNQTIDQIDFTKLPSLTNESTYFHDELRDCIYNAAESKNVNIFKHILETVQKKSEGKISLDRMIDAIYFAAIQCDFSPACMEKLLDAIPIDINRPITSVWRDDCYPAELHKDSLLHLAIAFYRPNIVDFLLSKGADADQLSHGRETPQQILENMLKDKYEVSLKQRMLESINNAKRKISCTC